MKIVDFAQEMLAMTQEALNDFQGFPAGQVDPELVRRVEGIDGELNSFIDSSSSPDSNFDPDYNSNFDPDPDSNFDPDCDSSFDPDPDSSESSPGITSDSNGDWM